MYQFRDSDFGKAGASLFKYRWLIFAIACAFGFAWFARYDVQHYRGFVIRLDRWTGEVDECDGNGCRPVDVRYAPNLHALKEVPRMLGERSRGHPV